MITFAQESLKDIWEEKVRCGKDHWKELELDKDGDDLCPRFEQYEAIEKLGIYFEYVARIDGEMVGLFGIYVTPSMTTGKMVATEDCWYLKPEHRGGKNALKFYRFVENEAKKKGAKTFFLTIPTSSTAGRFLERQGCKVEAEVYQKEL